jgi:hypothetical protein
MRMGLIENRAHYTTARCAIRSGATASPQRVSGNVDGGAPETLEVSCGVKVQLSRPFMGRQQFKTGSKFQGRAWDAPP